MARELVFNALSGDFDYIDTSVAAHDQDEHDRAEAADIAAVAAVGSAGVSVEVPNADHVHPHGSGYAGAHSDAVNDGDAAGGDLSGTYPNPSVTDDSHAHTNGTLTVAHASTTGKTPNDHHAQAHTHPAEGAVVVTHASTTGQTVDDHHARDHSIIGATHTAFPGGTTNFLRADGTFAAPPGGGGSSDQFLSWVSL